MISTSLATVVVTDLLGSVLTGDERPQPSFTSFQVAVTTDSPNCFEEDKTQTLWMCDVDD